ncbi:Uma2 family endonuclease [Thermomonospora cellulosilytica]|uniref:Uma2 family endonuclease n=1 Tax=Thermomonospora cellulosilytica TaxID=1411118 RepID=A0A7W3RBV1_9ACTN|nr:Uma2 family endonuclease [Thermomonospora cellulosilytica]MBA9007412.1 Uma2 family endonuclease [Thermomonospora cellulosilytica]
MSITTISEHPVKLPDTAHAMWERGELRDFLHLPHDHSKVEIIEGKIVVSPAPRGGHAGVIKSLIRALVNAQAADPEFPWDFETNFDLNLVSTGQGYCPDLMVMRAEVAEMIERGDDRHFLPDHVEMVVEITSPSNAAIDREPVKAPKARSKSPATKWTGYARAEIPYYLLVDRDPKGPLITLYSVPDPAAGAYLHSDAWEFGDTVTLEHFGLEIDTTGWAPWKD